MNAFRSFQVINEPVFHTAISDLPFTELAENEVLVKIAYSDVNYKDALAMSESGQEIRTYPMTPGIDLSGTVVQSVYLSLISWQIIQPFPFKIDVPFCSFSESSYNT